MWVHHLRSSQAFAFNLFGPLAAACTPGSAGDWGWAREVWSKWFGAPTKVEFEYPNQGDPLHEDDGAGHRTRVDVKVDHDSDRSTFVEVKLTELEFGPCSAGRDDDNPRREFCERPGWKLETAGECYLAAERNRAYFKLMNDGPVDLGALEDVGRDGCPLRGGLYQIARNLLIAGQARPGRVRFAVAAPGPRLNRQLHSPKSLHGRSDLAAFLQNFAVSDRVETAFIQFEDVLELARPVEGAAPWLRYMEAKYLLSLEAGAGNRPETR